MTVMKIRSLRSPALRRAPLATLLLALGVLAASALAASSHTYPTHLRLSARAPAFHGKVESSSPACIAHRGVKMLKKTNGHDKLLGVDRSDSDGEWQIPHPNISSGIFYARVLPGGSDRRNIICEPDHSRPVVVD